MSGITREGFTKNPIYPTSVTVDYGTTGALAIGATLEDNANSDWHAYTGGTSATGGTPVITDELMNAFPTKVEKISGTKLSFQPGVWEYTIQYILLETDTQTAEIGFALTSQAAVDYDETVLLDYDLKGNSNIQADSVYSGVVRGAFALPVPTNVRFRAVNRDTTGALLCKKMVVHYQRISNYTAS